MFEWLRKMLERAEKQSPWAVAVNDGLIVTSDGQGTERQLAVIDLQRVVVATDDSGPWDADVVFLLYSDGPDPVGIFPLEARGSQDFVAWLSTTPGYRDRELAKAMASTQIAQFEVYKAAS